MRTHRPEQLATRERVVGSGAAHFERVRARLAAMELVGHAGLDAPTRVTMDTDEAVSVTEARAAAPTLQEVLNERGSLRAGECVWVGTAVADALAALHRAGIPHGAVVASAVQLRPAGAVLGMVVDGAEDATAPDDVAALGTMLAVAVREADADRVRAWTGPMTHPDPAARPTAAMVARALGSCAPPEPLVVAPRGIASSMRASAADATGALSLPEARSWRLRLHATRWLLRGAVAFAMVAVCVAGGVAVRTWLAHGRAEMAAGVVGLASPIEAAEAATLVRFAALSSGDGAPLVASTLVGSPARQEAQTTADALASGALSVEGLAATVEAVAPGPGLVGMDAVVVRVRYTLGAHAVVLDGTRTHYEEYTQTVDLNMVRGTDGTWLVENATAVT